MHYLTHYTEEAQKAAMSKAQAFYAFGQDQFNERRVEGVKYVHIGTGLLYPKENIETLMKELDEDLKSGIAADIAENGIDKIIRRELGNYECHYTGDYSEVTSVLKDYGVTAEQVQAAHKKFYAYCLQHDLL